MDLRRYRSYKALVAEAEASEHRNFRQLCPKCRKATRACFCAHLKPFATAIEFVILIHPKENRNRVGTGRMTHLSLANSHLIEGVDFTSHAAVNEILNDPARFCVLLYPGPKAIDLTHDTGATLQAAVPAGKRLVIVVVDGTWSCANKILRLSRNLRALAQVAFVPPNPSIFKIRRQPRAICFSTIEAVHFMLGKLDAAAPREQLLDVFRAMIAEQLSHVRPDRPRAWRGNRRPEKTRDL